MRDARLRQMAADLIERPVVAAPAVREVAARAAAYSARQQRQARVLAVALASLLVLSVLSVSAHGGSSGAARVDAAGGGEDRSADGSASDDPEVAAGPAMPTSTTSPPTTAPRGAGKRSEGIGIPTEDGGMTEPFPPGPGTWCEPAENGGATDVGVTATRVQLVLPAALEGPGAELGTAAVKVVKAHVDRVNHAGGVCGRLLGLRVVNGTSPTQFAGDVFASLATPFHAETDAALRDGSFSRTGLPIVGLDGLSSLHYSSPWAWPVGTSAAALARIGVYQTRRDAASTFAVVYDTSADWANEAAAAFSQFVQGVGGTVKASVGLEPGRSSYAVEAQDFNNRCAGESCDVVLLALNPSTAMTWLSARPAMGRMQTVGLPTLLNDRFAQDCAERAGSACDELMVWDPFAPPIGPFTDSAAVAQYREDSGGDVSALVESAGVGVRAFVEALRRLGPNVTRARLAAVLNEGRFDLGLSHPLDWDAPDRRGNHRALGLTLQVAEDAFTGWKDARTGWLADPRP